MKTLSFMCPLLVLVACLVSPLCAAPPKQQEQDSFIDSRNIQIGSVIPDEGYCDQPYVVITQDGNWLCTLTTGAGHEGQRGQHVVSTISQDKGKTWSELIDIEPANGPAASWVIPLITPSGRVYAFYNYNGDRIRRLGKRKRLRADTIGWYVYKYSDDNGHTWSQKRYRLPVRFTACDRTNDWQGKVQIFWGIDKPMISGESAYFGFTKLGKYMLEKGEGWLFRSDNILSEPDVEKIEWQMLPDGDSGLRVAEFGSSQEEHNLVGLSDGSLYCMYRCTMGHPCHTYSRDGGHTWEPITPATYTPGGRVIKHPRACPPIWRTQNGKFLFWYHNNGGKDFKNRNPVWICGGIEKNGHIHWSQPEILLYDPDPSARMSYPDLIEQDNRYWVTETQKTLARVHEVDPTLLEGLWNQGKAKKIAREGLVLDLNSTSTPKISDKTELEMPVLPPLDGGGFTLDLWLKLDELSPGQLILDSRDRAGKGIALTTTHRGTLQISMSDGKSVSSWDCDVDLLRAGQRHHVVVIVDGGPKIITFVVDGVLCDGGTTRQFGWGRFDANQLDVNGAGKLTVAPSIKGELESLRLYNRYLRTSEAISNYLSDAASSTQEGS